MHLFSTSDSLVDKVIHFTVWLNSWGDLQGGVYTPEIFTGRYFLFHIFCSDAYFSKRLIPHTLNCLKSRGRIAPFYQTKRRIHMNTTTTTAAAKRSSTLYMVELAMMIAIILLMSFTPLGYLRTPGLSITLLTIPVAVGAIILGPKGGAVCGFTFGATSFYMAVCHRKFCFRSRTFQYQPGSNFYCMYRSTCTGRMNHRTYFCSIT